MERFQGRRSAEDARSVTGLLLLVIVASLALTAWIISAADITGGYTFTSGEKNITHTKLNTLGAGTINTTFLTGKTADTTPATDDVLLTYDTSAGVFKNVTLANLVFDHLTLISNRTELTAVATNDLALVYDLSAPGHRKVTLDSLALGIATNYAFDTTPASADTLLFYSVASDGLRRLYRTNLFYNWGGMLLGSLGVNGLTAYTTPTNADKLWIWDGGNNLNKGITITNLLVGGYPAKGAPENGDLITIYDSTANVLKQATLSSVVALATGPSKYTVTNAMPSAGTMTTNAHGLAGTPQLVRVVLQNTDTDLGYAADEEVNIESALGNTGSNEQDAFAILADGTNIVIVRNSAANFSLLHRTTGTVANADPAKWQVKTYAVYFQ